MFTLDPEQAALARLFRRDGWIPPERDVLPITEDCGDDDPRWEDFVAMWDQDDCSEGDDQ